MGYLGTGGGSGPKTLECVIIHYSVSIEHGFCVSGPDVFLNQDG